MKTYKLFPEDIVVLQTIPKFWFMLINIGLAYVSRGFTVYQEKVENLMSVLGSARTGRRTDTHPNANGKICKHGRPA